MCSSALSIRYHSLPDSLIHLQERIRCKRFILIKAKKVIFEDISQKAFAHVDVLEQSYVDSFKNTIPSNPLNAEYLSLTRIGGLLYED